MSNYLGKGCQYLSAQWEDQNLLEPGDMRYLDWEPMLVYCNHEDNPDNFEGNCNASLCPLHKCAPTDDADPNAGDAVIVETRVKP